MAHAAQVLALFAGCAFIMRKMADELNPHGRGYTGWLRRCDECGRRLEHDEGCSRAR